MVLDVNFSDSYREARQKFLHAARGCGAHLSHHSYPCKGQREEDLYVDVARVGGSNLRKALFVISGTHGVEGFLGSACQTAWLRSSEAQGADEFAVYLVHALNPYGFDWCRRVTEDNVDLNRNFIDFAAGSLPGNPEYRELERFLNPRALDEANLGKLDLGLQAWFGSQEKIKGFKAAVGKGQYEFPKGIIFGGERASWSNTFFRRLIASVASDLVMGIVLDIHTGLGQPGELEIFTEESTGKFKVLGEWFLRQKVTTLGDPRSLGYTISGSLYQALTRSNTLSPWHCAALEFGTQPIIDVLLALQADNWLHCFAKRPNQLSERIRQMMKAAFSFESGELKDRTIRVALEVIQNACVALRAK